MRLRDLTARLDLPRPLFTEGPWRVRRLFLHPQDDHWRQMYDMLTAGNRPSTARLRLHYGPRGLFALTYTVIWNRDMLQLLLTLPLPLTVDDALPAPSDLSSPSVTDLFRGALHD